MTIVSMSKEAEASGLNQPLFCKAYSHNRCFHADIVELEIGGVAIYRLFRKFHRAKPYCHLYGDQGQRQAYFKPHTTMNFVGLDLTPSDREKYYELTTSASQLNEDFFLLLKKAKTLTMKNGKASVMNSGDETTTSDSNSSTSTPGHRVKQRLDGMYRYRCACAFNTMTHLINRSDWRMVTSQSLSNHGQGVFIGERSGERAGQGNSRTFSVQYQQHAVVHYPDKA
ncbi:hypothetical protein TNCV_4470801 [Trichonephila clavipes]|uniref:Uncharacterized protein n=1 Tax=Trichonephila clavipes TaxID=2585209 RepID=A0A8X6VKW2_TRICX|nr:hypothetical protein TNCV_4470801 [Trichonephila clavipes]